MNPKTAEALDSVRQLQVMQMAQRINDYLRGVDPQIKRIASDIETAARRGSNVDSLRNHLTELQQLVEGAKKKIADRDQNGAIRDLNGVLHDIKTIQELLNSMKRELITISRPVQERPNRGP